MTSAGRKKLPYVQEEELNKLNKCCAKVESDSQDASGRTG
jgi:hypothetical protein